MYISFDFITKAQDLTSYDTNKEPKTFPYLKLYFFFEYDRNNYNPKDIKQIWLNDYKLSTGSEINSL